MIIRHAAEIMLRHAARLENGCSPKNQARLLREAAIEMIMKMPNQGNIKA